MKNLLRKENLLTTLLLLFLIVILNGLVFSNQLNYGFRDVDWQVLYYFKLFGNLSLDHLTQEIKVLGVYIPESYYVGLLEKFLGLNFVNLHQVTHFFKIISAISLYILVLQIFKRRLLAFISSLIYTISYTQAGALFQLSSGGYFLTIIFMNLFLITYYFSKVKKDTFKWSVVAGILLIITLALKPERMYPLIPAVFLVEFITILLGKFKKDLLIISLKRTFIILLPLAISLPFYNVLFTQGVSPGFSPNQFFLGTNLKLTSILNGNLQFLIDPFASLGSMFLYEDYWKILGHLNFQNFQTFFFSLLFGPILRLGLITYPLFLLIDRKPYKQVFFVCVTVFIFALIIYALNINWQNIAQSTRIHFDPNLIGMPSIFGFYIFTLTLVFFIKWLRNKDVIFLPLIIGFNFAFLFILFTWISSDILLVFMGPQRYLSIPSVGTSIFISGIFVLAFDRLSKIERLRFISWTIFLFLIPMIYINFKVANKFFEDELTFAGLRGVDQIRMKNTFRNLTGEISKEDKSLFYFDETADKENGYFDESTIIAGFQYWTRVNNDGGINNFPDPGMIRTNIQCPEHTHQNCMSILKTGLGMENGQIGIWYKDPTSGNDSNFYKLNNFYAYRFKKKNIIDIRKDVLRELGL